MIGYGKKTSFTSLVKMRGGSVISKPSGAEIADLLEYFMDVSLRG